MIQESMVLLLKSPQIRTHPSHLVISLASALWKDRLDDALGACPRPSHLPTGQLCHIQIFFNLFPNSVEEKLSSNLGRTVHNGGRESQPLGIPDLPMQHFQ